MDSFNLSDIEIKSNKFTNNVGEHTFFIDIGNVNVFGDDFIFSLEETGILVDNMFRDFNVELFQIMRSLVHYRGAVYHLNKQFKLTVVRGRIFIDNVCRYFTIDNNVITIIMTETADNIIRPPRRRYTRPVPLRNPHINVPPTLAAISADKQNTHNSKILDKLYDILIKIKNKTKLTLTFDESVIEIRDLIYINDCKLNEPSHGMEILNYIVKQRGYIDRFQMYENEVLALIWNAVRDDDELKKIFYTNLLSMYERDAVVCLTGRVGRMIDVFSGIVETRVDITLIRREMMDKCIKIRDTVDSDILKDEIRKQLYADYVESKILTKIELDCELNEWIDDI